jgi:FkbM family methyltransferase
LCRGDELGVLRRYLRYAGYVWRYRSLSRSAVSERLWADYQRNPPQFTKTLEGFYLFLNPDDRNLSFQVAASGTYKDLGDPRMTSLFKRLLKNSSLVVDVGANIGWYTFLAANEGCNIVAFEPEPYNFSMLNKSKDKNAFHHVELLNCALSESAGNVLLSVSANPGHHSIVKDVGAEKISVPSTTLDAVFPSVTIDLLKIDAEGAEPLILKGATCLIRERRIKALLLEWNPNVWNDRQLLHNFEILNMGEQVLRELPSRPCNLYLRPLLPDMR